MLTPQQHGPDPAGSRKHRPRAHPGPREGGPVWSDTPPLKRWYVIHKSKSGRWGRERHAVGVSSHGEGRPGRPNGREKGERTLGGQDPRLLPAPPGLIPRASGQGDRWRGHRLCGPGQNQEVSTYLRTAWDTFLMARAPHPLRSGGPALASVAPRGDSRNCHDPAR